MKVENMQNYLSIDIGGTNIKFAELDGAGNIIRRGKVDTPHQKSEFLKAIDQIINKCSTNIKGLAICSPGKIEKTKIKFGGSLPFLDGIDFEELYGNKYKIPISIINDGKASVLAENWLGSLKDEDNCAAITLGTAVGGGIVVNGKLVRGIHNQAGELSFMITNSHNANDMKGNVGSLASAVQLIKNINKQDDFSDLTDGMHAFDLIKKNEPQSLDLFDEYCKQIAIIILNIQSVVDIKKVAIGGGISAQPILIQGINDAYDTLTNTDNSLIGATLTKPEIVTSKFRNDSNLYDALYNLLLELDGESI